METARLSLPPYCISLVAVRVALVAFILSPSVDTARGSSPTKLDEALCQTFASSRVIGAAWATVRLGEVSRFGTYGFAGLNAFGVEAVRPTPISAATRMRAGSCSKLLTALLALRLHANRVLQIDEPIDPQSQAYWFGTSGQTQAITIASLLEHTAGLPGSSYRDYATGLPDASVADFLSTYSPMRPRWPAQRFFSYSNPGYGFAAAALEEASGRSFDELMRSEVFDPLSLSSASFLTEGDRPELLATGHDRQGSPQATWAMLARPAGSLVITAEDLAKVVRMCLRRGTLPTEGVFLPEELIERMEQGQTSAAARNGVREASYGLGNFGFAIDGRIWRGHWGKTDGFLTNVGYLPEHGVGFVLMINTDAPRAMSEGRSLLAEHLTEGLPVPARPALNEAPVDPTLAGWYVNATHDMPTRDWLFRGLEQKRVRVEGDALRVDSLGPFGVSSDVYRRVATGGWMPDSLPIATAATDTIDGERYWLEGEAFVRVSWLEAQVRRHMVVVASVAAVALLVLALGRVVLRKRGGKTRHPRSLANAAAIARWAAAVSFLLAFWLFVRFGLLGNGNDLRLLGQPSLVSVTLAISSLSTVLASIAAFAVQVVLLASQRRRVMRYVEAVLCLPLVVVSTVWIANGWAPLITWR